MTLRIGTRSSQLALAQTNLLIQILHQHHPDLTLEVVPITSQGDKLLQTPLAELSKIEKGLFTSELESALLSKKIDVAVHSLKDLPTAPENSPLCIAAILPREDPTDLLIVKSSQIPKGKFWQNLRIGTSSPRRCAQLLEAFPEAKPITIRGNVPTRLRKLLSSSDYDAIVLAAAGLLRLNFLTPTYNWTAEAKEFSSLKIIPLPKILPAPAQGAIAAQIRSSDATTAKLLQPAHCPQTAACVQSERALLHLLGGGCSLALGAKASINSNSLLHLQAVFFPPSHSQGIRAEATSPASSPLSAANRVAENLKSKIL